MIMHDNAKVIGSILGGDKPKEDDSQPDPNVQELLAHDLIKAVTDGNAMGVVHALNALMLGFQQDGDE
jgi:hypothetical protein